MKKLKLGLVVLAIAAFTGIANAGGIGYIDYVNSSGSPLFDYTGDSVVPNLLVGGDMPWGRKHLLL